MRVSTAQIFAQGLANMLGQQAGVARTQNQIASGRRILQPADDPIGAKRVMDLERAIAQAKQYEENGHLARSRLQREESVLVGVTDVLNRARELALQGNNATLTGPDRAAITRELDEQLEQLTSLANATDGNGEYLFSGFATRTEPFSTLADGSVRYEGDEGGREVQVGPSRRVAVSDPGSRVFEQIRTGNGSFTTGYELANTGSGVIDPGTVTDRTVWDGGDYELRVAAATSATGTLSFSDGGAPDTLTYDLAIDGTTVYSVDSTGAPVATLADLAAQINDDTGTTGVRAIVDAGTLYLQRTSPSADPIVVTETLSGGSSGDADGVVGYFGRQLTGLNAPSDSVSVSEPARWFATDAAGSQVASGEFQSGAVIAFRGIKTDINGTPGLGDSFTVAASADQDMFATVARVAAALRAQAAAPGDGTRRQNDVNRAVVDLDRALERVIQVRAGIGARLQVVDAEASAGQDFSLVLNEAVAEVRDLDMAEAITRLAEQSTALQAAQQSFVRIQGLSLFNFLG